MHTEVRWLSAGKSLLRFFELRIEILVFLQTSVKDTDDLQAFFNDTTFIAKSSIFNRLINSFKWPVNLNELNRNLQGKNMYIFEQLSLIDGFKKRLLFLKNCFIGQNYDHFQCFGKIVNNEFFDTTSPNYDEYLQFFDNVSVQFENRFKDFDQIRHLSDIFYYPMKCKIEQQPVHLQLELINLQSDISLSHFETFDINFWKNVSETLYPNIRECMLRLHCMFGSTYACEQNFSLMKIIKNKYWGNLTEVHLEGLLRIGTSKTDIDFDSLIAQA